jgi:4-cresol dehydrogenase (hydroxylating)
MTLPPGISDETFRRALQDFANVVGTDWVFHKQEEVAAYNDAFSPFVAEPERQRVASAAVAPTEVEQVRQIVRIANQYRIPLYAISTGRNLGYGGSAPNLSGSVVVDLKRMKRIIEVNTREGYMIVEPGVSFIEVHRHFEEHGIDYVPSAPGPGWGSPIGNALDRGVGFPYGDNFSAVKGLEVVLANGEVLRTGRGALGDPRLWPLYRYGLGPDLLGLFLQGNFGIVTKACFWIEPKSELSQGFSISSPSDADLEPMIDAMNQLSNQHVINGFNIASPLRSSTGTNDGRPGGGPAEAKELLRRRDGGSSAEWEALARKVDIPLASAGGGARGPRAVVKARLDYAVDYLKRMKVPGTIQLGMEMPGAFPISIDFGALAVQGGNLGHYYFSPVLRRTREDLFGINDTIRNVLLDEGDLEMLDEFGFSGGIGGVDFPGSVVQEKHMGILMEFLVYDDAGKNRRRRELFTKLVKACGDKGWAEYRAPVIFQDDAVAPFSYNNHSQRHLLEAIYDAIDPNGILSPGRYGIWPKHMRAGS